MSKSRREDMGFFSSPETHCLSYSAIPGSAPPWDKKTDKQRETTKIQFTAVDGLLNSQATLKPGGFVSLLALIGKTQAEMLLSGQDPGLGEGKGKQVVSASMPQKAPKGCFSSMKCAICFTVSDSWKVLSLGLRRGPSLSSFSLCCLIQAWS